MGKYNSRKRIFLIAKILYEKSDENNHLTREDITMFLNENDIMLDRKTFKEDIDFLIEELGCDIIVIKGSPNRYFWGDRIFEIPELKMLIDAVASSHFINKKKSKIITDKLVGLASDNQKEQLVRNIFSTGKAKSDNNKIYFIIDILNDAINKGKKVKFKYHDYNHNKEKVFKNNGEAYEISPYALYWSEDNYYVVGYSEKRKSINTFRVDRVNKPKILDVDSLPQPENFNIADFGNKVFNMFTGEEYKVGLECKNEVMKYIIDKFGESAEISIVNEEKFSVNVVVEVSPTFFSWVFQFVGKIKILGPNNVKEEFNNMLKENLND